MLLFHTHNFQVLRLQFSSLDCLRMHHFALNFQKFSRGACPWTPLAGSRLWRSARAYTARWPKLFRTLGQNGLWLLDALGHVSYNFWKQSESLLYYRSSSSVVNSNNTGSITLWPWHWPLLKIAFLFYYCDNALSIVIYFSHFRLSSETAERNSTKLDRKARSQHPLLSMCFFQAVRSEKQDGCPGLWLA